MKEDLITALSLKARAEGLMSNLEKLKGEHSISDNDYEVLRSEYTYMLDEAIKWVSSLQSSLNKDLCNKKEKLEVLTKELNLIKARLKVGEISIDKYREIGKPLEDQCQILNKEIADYNKMVNAKSATEFSGQKDISKPEISKTNSWWNKLRNIRPVIFSVAILIFILSISFTITALIKNSKYISSMGTIVNIEQPQNTIEVNSLRGRGMPNFQWQTAGNMNSNKLYSLVDFSGKAIIIVFDKNYHCPGADEQRPYFLSLNDQYRNSGLMMSFILRSDILEDSECFRINNNLNCLCLADPEDLVANKVGFAVGIPISLFINVNFIIEEYKIGPFKNQSDIENILKSLY